MISVIQKLWRDWCRYWNPAYEAPLAGDVMLKQDGEWRPTTDAERAELLRLLTLDLQD